MMKRTAVVLAFFSVILSSCSQFQDVPAKEPASPPVVQPAAEFPSPPPVAPGINPDDFVSKNDFSQFQKELIPAVELKKMFSGQEGRMQELAAALTEVRRNAVEKPELLKSQEQMIPKEVFDEYVSAQQRVISELKRENMALREISKDMVCNASKIAELRCDEIWRKSLIIVASFMISVLALIGAAFIKLSRRINNL